ncbi:hypothetical protein VTG60DRAFT_4585 [Thermothelomyces hinnuleus]
MAVSPPRSRAVDTEFPCMPRRQSCDRCHEQKVRCVTEGAAGSEALGGIAEEGTQNPGGHVVSSVPCVRCRKAGAVCIYSLAVRPPTASTGFESGPASETRETGLEKLLLFFHRFTRIQPAVAGTASPPDNRPD